MINLALVNLEDLKIILAENAIKNEATKGNIPGTKVGEAWRFRSLALKAFEISLVMYLVWYGSSILWRRDGDC